VTLGSKDELTENLILMFASPEGSQGTRRLLLLSRITGFFSIVDSVLCVCVVGNGDGEVSGELRIVNVV